MDSKASFKKLRGKKGKLDIHINSSYKTKLFTLIANYAKIMLHIATNIKNQRLILNIKSLENTKKIKFLSGMAFAK